MAEVAEKKVVVKQPSLRFPDFNGKIRIDNLGKYIDVISGYPFKGEDISEINNGIRLLRGINITEGFIRHNADIDRYYNKSINGLEKYLLETGDVVLGMDGSKVGKNVSIIQSKHAGSLLVQRIARIRPKGNCDIKFVFQQLFSPKFRRYVDKVNTSSGIPHISLKQIKEFNIAFPSFDEQKKIAFFLSAVDKRIDLLEQKKAKLEEYKKGGMQKIFSQEIRFKPQFEDLDLPPGTVADLAANFPDWEKKKIGEILEIGSGKDYKHLKEGKVPVYGTGGIMCYVNDHIFEGETVCIGRKGTIDKPYFLEGKLWTVDTLFYTHSYNKCHPKFIYYLFLTVNWQKYNEASGVPSLSKQTINNIPVQVPCIEEQKKIASFLTSIDNKIELVENQIEGTKQFKKGLLQQMFV